MVVTNSALTTLLSDIKTDITTALTHGQVGTGTTAPAKSNTALEAQVFRDTLDEEITSVTDVVSATLFVLTGEGNGNALTEFAVDASGTLWTRNILTAINKTNDIQVFLTAEFKIEVIEV